MNLDTWSDGSPVDKSDEFDDEEWLLRAEAWSRFASAVIASSTWKTESEVQMAVKKADELLEAFDQRFFH